ncbi:Transcription initiation factor TFIID subunit 5, partial [Spiromyces aspiralis]
MNNAKKPGDDAGSDRTGNGPSAKEQDASKKHVERIVLQYLQSKGYKSAEQALREEADLNAGENNEISLEELAKMFPTDETSDDVNVPSWILMYNQAEQGNPDAYGQSYSSLRRWIDMSLDIYKNELFAVSYPLFVHSFLDLMARDLCEKGTEFLQKYKDDHLVLHSDDIKQLSTIKSPQHVKENELAKLFRNNKYCLKLSNVGLELLLTFLQEHKFMLLLRIVNQYLSIQTREGAASAGSIEDADIGITGHTQHQIDQFNSQAVTLGPLSMNPMLREETEQTLRMQLKGQKHKVVKTPIQER